MLEQLDVYMQKKKMYLDIDFTPFKKVNLKWTRNLSIKCKTIVFPEEDKWENLCDLELGDGFLDTNKTNIYERKKWC